jgi:hypothetical protein
MIISGARYAGVPHYSWMICPFLIIFETPKSHIFTPFSQSSRMLSSLISRCITLLQWICARPYAIYLKINLASDSYNFPLRLIRCNRSPPPAYSITISICLLLSNTSNSLMTFECLIFFNKYTS